jgi:hypothetical protein
MKIIGFFIDHVHKRVLLIALKCIAKLLGGLKRTLG